MIKNINGDLLKAKVDIIAHQVNCLGIMGGGIALSIKNKYPEAFNSYYELCKNDIPANLLGTVQILPISSGKYLANLFGQNSIGFGLRTNYTALEASLRSLKDYAMKNELSVGIPFKLGCGLAGGEWEIVLNIIEDVFSDYEIIICKL